MNPFKSLSWKSVVAIALLAAAVPSFAQKRRSVQHPGPGVPATPVTVTGTVVDAVTGQPIFAANVRVLNRSDNTDRQGKFRVINNIYGTASITVGRTGYVPVTQQITPGTHEIAFRLQPTPTVKLRTTAGAEYDLDFESAEFGYVPPFGSYNKSEGDDFCKPNGQMVTINRSEIARITGPAVSETNAACCPNQPLLKINAVLKSGETTPLYFVDSCLGYSIDFIGRDHVKGDIVYTKFINIAEIIFP
jgi:Carboxypeptidase regulatory-like domain